MNILVVEDNQTTLRLHELKLCETEHTVLTAVNGIEAFEKLKKNNINIVISDWIMPEMNGLDLCTKIRDTNFKRYIYFIIVSSRNTQEEIIRGLEAGVDDYIVKPINYNELRARIEIGARIVNLEKKATSRYSALRTNYFQTIQMFTSLLEVFDENLGGHSRRVGSLSLRLAKKHPDFLEKDYQIVKTSGLLHDIGMVGLPGEIFSKKRTELNGDERQMYLSHPVRGELILKEIELLSPIAQIVRYHHEQYNGKGFPDGLSGKKIPLSAQIVSAASIYDNIIHRGMTVLEDIPEKLYKLRGYQLNPFIVDLLLDINTEDIIIENKKIYISISTNDLVEGMVLVKDIRMKSGAIVLPASTELTRYDIKKLTGYSNLHDLCQNVFVYKSSIKG